MQCKYSFACNFFDVVIARSYRTVLFLRDFQGLLYVKLPGGREALSPIVSMARHRRRRSTRRLKNLLRRQQRVHPKRKKPEPHSSTSISIGTVLPRPTMPSPCSTEPESVISKFTTSFMRFPKPTLFYRFGTFMLDFTGTRCCYRWH